MLLLNIACYTLLIIVTLLLSWACVILLHTRKLKDLNNLTYSLIFYDVKNTFAPVTNTITEIDSLTILQGIRIFPAKPGLLPHIQICQEKPIFFLPLLNYANMDILFIPKSSHAITIRLTGHKQEYEFHIVEKNSLTS